MLTFLCTFKHQKCAYLLKRKLSIWRLNFQIKLQLSHDSHNMHQHSPPEQYVDDGVAEDDDNVDESISKWE